MVTIGVGPTQTAQAIVGLQNVAERRKARKRGASQASNTLIADSIGTGAGITTKLLSDLLDQKVRREEAAARLGMSNAELALSAERVKQGEERILQSKQEFEEGKPLREAQLAQILARTGALEKELAQPEPRTPAQLSFTRDRSQQVLSDIDRLRSSGLINNQQADTASLALDQALGDPSGQVDTPEVINAALAIETLMTRLARENEFMPEITGRPTLVPGGNGQFMLNATPFFDALSGPDVDPAYRAAVAAALSGQLIGDIPDENAERAALTHLLRRINVNPEGLTEFPSSIDLQPREADPGILGILGLGPAAGAMDRIKAIRERDQIQSMLSDAMRDIMVRQENRTTFGTPAKRHFDDEAVRDITLKILQAKLGSRVKE